MGVRTLLFVFSLTSCRVNCQLSYDAAVHDGESPMCPCAILADVGKCSEDYGPSDSVPGHGGEIRVTRCSGHCGLVQCSSMVQFRVLTLRRDEKRIQKAIFIRHAIVCKQ